MPYDLLEQQIKTLPPEAKQEVFHYVGYLLILYNKKNPDYVSEKVEEFMAANPDSFKEFKPATDSGIEKIRELTKND